jgi:ribosomal protein S12 methylthiotransferase accessory factor
MIIMLTRPVFKAHLRAHVIPGEGVLLLSEDGARALHGKVYEELAPLIDGSRDADAMVDGLAGKVEAAKVYYALMLLEKNGHLAENAPEIPPETAAFWHGMEIEPVAAIKALGARRVRVLAVGKVDGAPLRLALAELGIIATDGESADFEVVVTDDYQRAELEALNTAALQAGRPWLLIKPVGHELWIGPLFVPGETGCHSCLTSRLARNRPVHRFAAEKNEPAEPPAAARAGNPASIGAACRLAAVEAAKFIAGAKDGLQGKVLSLDLRTWNAVRHELLKHPACPACGAADQLDQLDRPRAVPVELVARKVTYIQDGGHRAATPEQTIKKYEHLVSPITGVVTTLAPVHQADGLVHVYMAGHNHAFKMESLDFLKRSLRNASAGKGAGEAQAKASALCEAIERYSGERTGAEVIVTASFREMGERFGADVIHPNAVMRYSEKQLAEREAWNAKKSKFNRVPEPLEEAQPIDWTPVWSLTHGRHKYLPTQLLYYQSPASAACPTFYSMGCSNGNASGNNLEEAVLQGFCELVERDAVALWWYNRLPKPGVAVESFDEPYLLDLMGYYQTLGREAWALDITSDLGIPAFVAISRLTGGPEERILFGLGCHLDARIALQRAFAEMNQMLGMAQGGEEEEKLALEDDETLSWLKSATLLNQPYMAPDKRMAPRRREDYPSLAGGDLLADIERCRRIVEERGLEMLVLDQTRPDVEMPVAKVIVPGLRHFWARFAPGRLYEVPVAMGWLARPTTEEELNPIPIFF